METGDLPVRQAVLALPRAYYAVIDGALAPGLIDTLRAAGIVATPLYLEGGDPQIVASGPILAALHDWASFDRFQAMPVAATALYWSWGSGLDSLRRHLRSINLVEVPAEAIGGTGGGLETVILRHWDPNVVAPLLPLLSPEQEARFFGDAGGVAFHSPDYQRVAAIRPRAGLPPKPRGMLRFGAEQMAALSRARVLASHRRIAAYLRESAPVHLAAVDDATLLHRIATHQAEAEALGLRTETDVSRWSFLQVMAGGALFANPAVRDHFDPRHGHSASDMLDAMFEDVIHRLRAEG